LVKLVLHGLKLPEVRPGDDLVGLILDSIKSQGLSIDDGDVLVVTTKVISKAMGLLCKLGQITPSRKAVIIGMRAGVDPRFIELLLRECNDLIIAIPVYKLVSEGFINIDALSKEHSKAIEVLKKSPTVFITVRNGELWSDCGIDTSNHPRDIYSVPPRDLDEVAKEISNEVLRRVGRRVAVVLCDTELFLTGSIDVARGCYGLPPTARGFGLEDLYGKPKFGGADAIPHEVCAAAALIMGQRDEGVPAVLIKGLRYEWFDGGLKTLKVIDISKAKKALAEIIKHTLRVLGARALIKLVMP